MLKKVTIEHFKGFGERTEIPLAPITLLYGENSAGKSSILQALAILKAVAANGKESRIDVLFPVDCQIETGNVGSFQDCVTDHDPQKTMVLRADYVASEDSASIGARADVSVSQPRALEVAYKDGINEAGYLASASLKCGDRTWTVSDPVDEVFGFLCENREYIRRGLVRDSRSSVGAQGGSQQDVSNRSAIKDFYSRDFTREDLMKWMCTDRQAWVIKLMPFSGRLSGASKASMDSADFRMYELGTEEDCGDGIIHKCWEASLSPIGEDAQTGFREFAEHLAFLQGIRSKPERSELSDTAKPRCVGTDGSRMPGCLFYCRPVCHRVNALLEEWRLGYQIEVDRHGLWVRDERSSSPLRRVSIADVGFGLSQVLPIVTQAFMESHQTIAIQQPEEHIHPRLQAEFGQFVADNVKTMGNQFIIETHSEHLMLRLQRLIRRKKLTPEHVRVLYVSRTEKGSSVQELRLDGDGEFIDDWPRGFFPERLAEILGG